MTSGATPDRAPATETSVSATSLGSTGSTLSARAPARRGQARAPERERPSFQARLQLRLVRLSDTAVVVSVLLAAFVMANIGQMRGGFAEFLALRVTVKNLVMLVFFALAWRVLCRATGLYDWESIRRRSSESSRVVMTCGLVSIVALVFPTVSVTGAFRYEAVLYFWLGSSVAMLALRNLTRALVFTPEASRPKDAVIVGSGPRGQRLARELRASSTVEYNVVGFVDSADQRPSTEHSGGFLGSLEQVESILMHSAIDEVLIALPIKSRYTEIQSVLESCERVGVPARYLADLFDPIRGRASDEGNRPSLITAPPSPRGWMMVTKRAVDVLGAATVLLLLSPALVLAALAIRLTSSGPILFVQERYGLNRRLFRMYKFRTMVADAEELQVALEDRNEASGPVFKIREDPRITPVGRLLRKSSLDEMPQLLNVLLGEMSLVGPRPLPVRDVHRFTEATLMRRFSVRPGVTCLWQISGRSDLCFDDWIRLDLEYIDEWSLALDLMILVKTVPAVLRGTGAS
jgi:exopolysaccharide biosynthesis polyprenyl glycosylphosphotransferase